MKPMLLTSASKVQKGSDWLYECKYDGFRCLLMWEEKSPRLFSRNEKELSDRFPEVITFCEERYEAVKPFLPLVLDGEMVHLVNSFKSEFSIVQTRGRMKTASAIQKHARAFSCLFAAFDLVMISGKPLSSSPFEKRKERMHTLFSKLTFPVTIQANRKEKIQCVETFSHYETLKKLVVKHYGEGIIAKRKTSKWESGKRSTEWLKEKNWRTITVFLTQWDKNNGYFTGAVMKNDDLIEIVHFRHGLEPEQEKTLQELFQSRGQKQSATIWTLPPSICVNIDCIDFDGKHVREPRFHSFNFEIEPDDCTWQSIFRQLLPIPERVTVTHPEKPVWPELGLRKDDYLLYLQLASPVLLPLLEDRLLTVIRYPHGAGDERFYQKNCPDYAPDFVKTKKEEDIDYILCNDLDTLLWLGNQLALEFHIPFGTIHSNKPSEIVFDLDPPSVNEFSLAVEAAVRMKAIFDSFQLVSFVKTSGGKGLQIYLPLPEDIFTYQETRQFTSFVCQFLLEQEPDWFTIERLKKNRGNKLYLDYLQHDEGKTIIAPYSPRGNPQGLIATPLYWHEVTEKLRPEHFPLPAVLERLKKEGDPFRDLQNHENEVPFRSILAQLTELTKK
ncbi:DNA ligase D [Jeotgalibacillus sp. ET6]|uniref:DNA ligase D n=1 Tax=Jeotgalibacillus sp. ET6 TaxID=3037260 RepID=UPI002418BC2C|nr:DNA ligase D [Jeotgalibacillus sp. ET6]MDG5472004.1 DNA ligase D [Jeotgalibacillus sp. ET6]